MIKTDAAVKKEGFEVLRKALGIVDMARFVALINRERFDYTKWRSQLFDGISGEEISRMSMENRKRLD